MAERTNISWADATLSFWIGCTKVSPACDFCYAEVYGNRFGVKWGPKEARRVTKNWVAKANKIMREAKKDGIERPFVFSNSLSDIFDNEVPLAVLEAALDVMRRFPKAVFLLLTKRPQNIVKRFTEIAKKALGAYADEEGIASCWPKNAAIGCTVVSQAEADRDIPWLLRAKAALNPAFAFLSMEPLLERVDLTAVKVPGMDVRVNVLTDRAKDGGLGMGRIDWVITGGESGPHARVTAVEDFAAIRDACARARVPYHHKQNGEWIEQYQRTTDMVDGRPVPKTQRFRDLRGKRYLRVGTKVSGRKIDGVIHDARPKVAA